MFLSRLPASQPTSCSRSRATVQRLSVIYIFTAWSTRILSRSLFILPNRSPSKRRSSRKRPKRCLTSKHGDSEHRSTFPPNVSGNAYQTRRRSNENHPERKATGNRAKQLQTAVREWSAREEKIAPKVIHGHFLRLGNFRLQNCAILRNAMRMLNRRNT
jgi:hypothetical protein